MIWTDELPASLDQIDGVVVFHRVEQTRVQQLAQELASKVRYQSCATAACVFS
jgi:translation initiation factor 3 subunit C